MGDISDYKKEGKLRRDYSGSPLTKKEVADDPFDQFDRWFKEALDDDLTDANAMTLATATSDGKPSARIVLLKDYGREGFRFYTNYNSRKGKELQQNKNAALCFYWAELNRQIRVEGTVTKASEENSANYFASRPRKSKLAAHASNQSSALSSRDELEQKFKLAAEKYENEQVPVPEYWGGFILEPVTIEFWQGRPSRMHDRLVYHQEDGGWNVKRLSP